MKNTSSTADRVSVASTDLVRLAAEFEAWAKATKVDFAKIHPRPRIPIYTPQIHPSREADWNHEWGNWLWPKAVKWWADRGYELKGRDGQWHVEPNSELTRQKAE